MTTREDNENKTKREKNAELYIGIGLIAMVLGVAVTLIYMTMKDKADIKSMESKMYSSYKPPRQ